ncbi:GGDEF domain-containing protein [Sinorhizobium sp. BG8]|uniref:GGDEF domain-containing protein n=1 Tax=Sinorhizobium sp. BG8 TaxID=2613773 RepID=UPI00193D5B99|nr:GGDEF domain-containing protein [Sinorhizobium sp. BG8]QRM55652.1 GGDEF domain-containing protein [Sinorhizobium sp. BG8]
MLEVLISLPTLLVCTFLSTLVVGIFLLLHLYSGRRTAAAVYWCVSMWVGSVASVLLGLRTVIAPELSIGVGNALAALGYSLTWAGFRSFDHKPVSRIAVAAGPAAWTAAYLFSDTFAADMSLRIILMSVVTTAYSLAMARELLAGHRREALPSRRVIAILLASHAVIYALRIPFAILSPVSDGSRAFVSPWFAVFALEIFLHTLIVAVSVLILLKERSEFVYRHAARTDALTGVLNRSAFMEEATSQLRRRLQTGVLMLLDLDHFKAINDTYGHQAGDQVLRGFAAAISARLAAGMVFARFGGEEFVLFAPDHDLDQAMEFADGLRRETQALSVSHYGTPISVSVSIGAASVLLCGGDLDDLITAADCALYRAKAEGRNRVSIAGPAESLMQVAERMREMDIAEPLAAVAR